MAKSRSDTYRYARVSTLCFSGFRSLAQRWSAQPSKFVCVELSPIRYVCSRTLSRSAPSPRRPKTVKRMIPLPSSTPALILLPLTVQLLLRKLHFLNDRRHALPFSWAFSSRGSAGNPLPFRTGCRSCPGSRPSEAKHVLVVLCAVRDLQDRDTS